MRELLIWGATGQAKVLHELIHEKNIKLVVLIDNRVLNSPFPDIPILTGEKGLDDWLEQRGGASGLYFSVAVGGEKGRDRLMLMDNLIGRGLVAETMLHKMAFIANDATFGEGCQILAQSAVCSHAKLGRGVIINTSASIDHDCEIGDGVHVAPGARLTGGVSVGACAFIGAGAVVLPNIVIGEDAIVGAGAVVTKDVASGVTVVGNPAQLKI
jgi:sugar O-acyltransferase (sialic acid O-acetyltransferase NeuD family)